MKCFNSEDPSIKNRALEIIKVTTTQDNCKDLVNEMLMNLSAFKDLGFQKNVILTIIDICTKDQYSNVKDFTWLGSDVLF